MRNTIKSYGEPVTIDGDYAPVLYSPSAHMNAERMAAYEEFLASDIPTETLSCFARLADSAPYVVSGFGYSNPHLIQGTISNTREEAFAYHRMLWHGDAERDREPDRESLRDESAACLAWHDWTMANLML